MIRLNQMRFNITQKEKQQRFMLYQPFDKYEYKTGADLGYKPEVVEQAKFGYSSLGQTLTNILKKE